MNTPYRDEELGARYFDQTLNEQELQELQALLISDTAAAERFARRCRLEVALRTNLSVAANQAKFVRLNEVSRVVKMSKRQEWLVAGVAALLGLSICGAWMMRNVNSDDPPNHSAELISGRFVGDGARRHQEKMPLNKLLRTIEPTVLEMADASKVSLGTGALFELHPAKKGERQSVELMEGKGLFKVAKAPGNFRVLSVAGEVKADGAEFSVELRPNEHKVNQNRGDEAMKLSKIMLVTVVAGMVEVSTGGVTQVIAGGQSRAFAGEDKPRPKKEGDKREGENKEPKARRVFGEITSVNAESITVASRGDGGPRSETVKITAATKIQYQSDQVETFKGEGGREVTRGKMLEGTAANLKQGARVNVMINEAGEAVRIQQGEGDRKREGGEGERKPNAEGARKEPDRKREGEGARKEPDRKREGEGAREPDRKPDAPKSEDKPKDF